MNNNNQPNNVEDENHDYTTNYENAKKLCEDAKHLITVENQQILAIAKYNEAVQILSNISVMNEEQENEYVTLLIRLYTNLAICYNRIEDWAEAKINCQELFSLCNTFQRQVDNKVYYNHAKALLGLHEYNDAQEMLHVLAENTFPY